MRVLTALARWLLSWVGFGFRRLARTLVGPRRVDVVRLRLEGKLAEGVASPTPFWWRWEKRTYLLSVLELFDRAGADPRVSAVLIEPSGLRAGWATLQTLRRAILRLKERGKKVVVYLEEGDNGLAYLASAADRVVMAPAGMLQLTGLRAEVLFLAGALERARVEPEFGRLGEVKAAVVPFTRTSLSPPARESLDAILDDLYEQLVTGLAEGRGLAPDRVQALIDGGPHRASEAKEAGLVDENLYEDELPNYLATLLGRPGVEPAVVEAPTFLRYATALPPPGAQVPFPKVALIVAEGVIRTGRARPSQLARGVFSASFAEAVRHAADNDGLSAIILRVDSPGGSGLASDLLWREVRRAREKKPVIVSMGDVAASGGYYLSMPSDWILAEPATLTGSIGVIAGKFSLKGLYERIGLTKETLDRGARAGAHSDYRPFTPEEREKLETEVRAYYDDFVEKAAEGRGLGLEETEAAARGRVWTGQQALSRRLVDELGGIVEAIAVAKKRAGIPAAQPVSIEVLPRSLPSLLAGLSWNPLRALPVALRDVVDLAETLGGFREGELLALLPFKIDIN